jgi:membrane-associated HD superfamily phosphohydrolase
MAYGIIGLLENVFGVTTDLSLLELADFNQPLLKLLSREATGTFTHCVTVGNLAEAAADTIGANALLARVGSYYQTLGNSPNRNISLKTKPSTTTGTIN